MLEEVGSVDSRKEQAEARKAEAEAAKAEAEARSAFIDSYVPEMPTELPRGALTAPEEPSPLGTLAAYRALSAAAASIAEAVYEVKLGELWIAPENPLPQAQILHQQVMTYSSQLLQKLGEAKDMLAAAEERPQPPLPGRAMPILTWIDQEGQEDRIESGAETPSSAGLTEAEGEEMVGSAPAALAAQLAFSAIPLVASVFKTQTTLLNDSLTIGFLPAATTVAEQLRDRAGNILIGETCGFSGDKVSRRISKLLQERDQLRSQLNTFRSKRSSDPPAVVIENEKVVTSRAIIEGALKKESGVDAAVLRTVRQAQSDLENACNNLAAFRAARAKDQGVIDSVTQLLKAADDVAATLTTGASAVRLASQFEQFTAGSPRHILLLEVSYAGRRSAYFEKVGPDREVHVGSVVITWHLIDQEGRIVKSGVTPAECSGSATTGKLPVEWSNS